jgi:16S rRNA C967 or C1407 C5-methylase (RsmB/RsmF family)
VKIFYDEIIQIGELMTHIQSLQIETEEKEELAQMVDETVHHEMLSVILTHLPEEHHEEFLERFQARPHDESLLAYLKAKVEGIEDKLKQAGAEIREKFKTILQSRAA